MSVFTCVSEFDFWVGEWDAGWGDDGHGRNSISKELDGKVVFERFDSAGLRGMSVSTLCADGMWRQTWVDSDGNYLDFEGGPTSGDEMELRRATNGRLFRMRWYDIEPDRFRWDWQRSDDGGETWETRWPIVYTRAA
jgi:hypothetical protein